MALFQECDLYYIVSVYYAVIGVCSHVALTIIITSILYWKIFREALSHSKKAPNSYDKRWESSITCTMVYNSFVYFLLIDRGVLVHLINLITNIQSTFIFISISTLKILLIFPNIWTLYHKITGSSKMDQPFGYSKSLLYSICLLPSKAYGNLDQEGIR